MKKVAVIGDSHVAMLYSALRESMVDAGDNDFSFYVWRSDGVKELIVKNSQIEITVPAIKILQNQENIVDVELYDVFLLCGLGFSLRAVIEIYKSYRHDAQVPGDFLISELCWDDAACGVAEESLAIEVCEALRNCTDKEVYLMPTPFASEHFLDDDVQTNLYKKCIENGDEEDIAKRFNNIKKVWENKGVKIVNQPEDTIHRSILTSGRLSNAHPDVENIDYVRSRGTRDLTHMKPEFGALMINRFLKMLHAS